MAKEATAAVTAEPASVETEPEETIESLRADRDQWKKFSRKHEDSAKANAEAATRLKEIEDAAKTAEQKALEELSAYKAQAESATSQLLKYEVASTKGIPASLLVGSTKEELEAYADALIAFKGETTPVAPVAPNLRQGVQGAVVKSHDINANLRAAALRGNSF